MPNQVEQFKAELDVLLAKYPLVQFRVAKGPDIIQIVELTAAVPVPTAAPTQTAPTE